MWLFAIVTWGCCDFPRLMWLKYGACICCRNLFVAGFRALEVWTDPKKLLGYLVDLGILYFCSTIGRDRLPRCHLQTTSLGVMKLGNACAANLADINFTIFHHVSPAEAPSLFAWSTSGNLSECGLWWAVRRPSDSAHAQGWTSTFRHAQNKQIWGFPKMEVPP